MDDQPNPTTLYIGNLDKSVSEELISKIFCQFGQIKSCKVFREPWRDPYAFVEFEHHQTAAMAAMFMNRRLFLDKELKVDWAKKQPKVDTSNYYTVYVGHLSQEIETEVLLKAFTPFGEISNCIIVRDPQTLKSKGYGFINFLTEAQAEKAILSMDGQWLGRRRLKVNWATSKPPTKALTFDEVYNLASSNNSTVYCGGLFNGIDDDLMYAVFSPFGPIEYVTCYKGKGYAFIKFYTKESAAHAIEGIHNTDINGVQVKCFWAKENEEIGSSRAELNLNECATSQWDYWYGGTGGGYWYPQAYPTTPGQIHYPPYNHENSGMTAHTSTYWQFDYQQNYLSLWYENKH